MLDAPYIGITGFTTKSEILKALNYGAKGRHTERYLMAGILLSSNTKSGIKNRYPNRYPEYKNIPKISFAADEIITLLHYSSDNPEQLGKEMVEIFLDFRDIAFIDGFQINACWPDIEHLEYFAHEFGKAIIVLQIGYKALQIIEENPKLLVEKLRAGYTDCIDSILLDTSGGKGKLLDINKIDPYLDALYESELEINIGIAGGLKGGTLSNGQDFYSFLKPFAEKYPDLSIDAEGQLRTEDDHLDPLKMEEYLIDAIRVFR